MFHLNHSTRFNSRRSGCLTLCLGLIFLTQAVHAQLVPTDARGVISGSFKGTACAFVADPDRGTPRTITSNEHVAKFACAEDADTLTLERQGNKLVAIIDGTECALQFDRNRGTPRTLSSREHVAKFDCANAGDDLVFEDNRINAVIRGRTCGLQLDFDAGTPGTLDAADHVAKFDCRNRGSTLTFTAAAEDNTDSRDEADSADDDNDTTTPSTSNPEGFAQGRWYNSSGTDIETNRSPAYILRLRRTDFVTIDLESNDADTVLVIIDRATQNSFEIDGGGNGNNARFQGFLAEGEYIVVATTANAHTTGAFTIASDEGTLDGLHAESRTRESQEEEQDYYEAIDPRDDKLTFNDWLDENGFLDQGGNIFGELEARYYNKNDLGLGREMHCLEDRNKVACYTVNYGEPVKDDGLEALAAAVAATDPVAIVALEYDDGDSDNPIKYYAFNGTGERVTELALDNEEAKSVPGVCLNCHGGEYNDRDQTITGSSFLPLDLEGFEFASEDFSEGAQSEVFRALNALVKRTNPNSDVAQLIDGWYDGQVERRGAVFNRNYVPDAWKNQALQYTYVVKPYCRTCHVGIGISLENLGSVSPSLFEDFICGYIPGVPIMPHGEMTDSQLWDDEVAIRMAVNNEDDCRDARFGNN
ncbi:MAG: hypothetical protein P8Y42_19315 [Exilibacterium sp.]